MPTFILPFSSTSSTISSQPISPESEKSFKSFKQNILEEIDHTMNSGKELEDISMYDGSKSPNLDNKSESGERESNALLREKLKCQELRHQLEIERMRSEMLELRLAMKQNDSNEKETTSVHVNTDQNLKFQQEESQKLKLKPITWPVAYDHKDRTLWNTTYRLLQYIYQRDVIQKRFLELSDFFMNLFSHAVTGVAKSMITGKFQEMLSNGQTNDALGLLTAMDDTYRDRNEEQNAALLFLVCKQFRDESLSSFLPRYQQLLARSPNSSADEKNKIYHLRSKLNQVTRNYMVGRSWPRNFSELLEYLYTIGMQIFPHSETTGDYCWVVINEMTFINVYKAPQDPAAVQPLLSWTPPTGTVAPGDFNSVYWAWKPGVTTSYGQGEEIEIWAEMHNLSSLIIGEPTHRAGNTLDLVFTNILEVYAWVDRDECVTSDHYPISGIVPCQRQREANKKGLLNVSEDQLPHYAKVVSQWLPPHIPLSSIDEIEKSTEEICRIIKEAIKAVGKHKNRGKGRSAPWWTPECKAAHLKYRNFVTESERSCMRKNLRSTFAAAKREYWKGQVEAVKSNSDIYKLMQWRFSKTSRFSPIFHNDQLISDQAELASILRDSLLARHRADDDLPPCPLSRKAWIPWKEEVTYEEVRVCTIGSGNTCPGADEILVKLLAACWDSIGVYITNLFRACIQLSYYPTYLKLVEVTFIPKAGRDPTSVKGWRPISLLSCLGKGLERMIAKKVSHLAIVSDIVGEQQFGALPKRSATGLVSCVVHDIEEARTQRWASMFVKLDVQGAFDAVLHNRLLWRMYNQGWPDSIFRWTCSFMKDRRVQVRFDGGITETKKLICGVPQGSPISPLLFLPYIAEPMRSGTKTTRFGYADDIGILGIGPTVAESTTRAQREVDSVLDWARENAVSFDTNKLEVVQFSSRRRENPVEILVNGSIINPDDNIRWLGVYLDPKLSFKHHVASWCGKAIKVAQHIRQLNSVKRAAAPGPLIKAVDMCVVPVATFGAEVWWLGMTRPTAYGIRTPQTSHLCSLVDRALHLALRAALPVWRTTPNVVLHREGGIPPAKILLEANRIRLAARLKTLDNRHPLRARACVCLNVGTLKYKKTRRLSKRPEIQMSRIQRAFRQLPSSETPEPLLAPTYNKSLGDKSEGIDAYFQWIRSIASTDICAYSDGSSEGHGRSSWGYFLQRGGVTFKKGQGSLYGGEVYDAEIMGETMALGAAILARRTGEKIFILLDNQSAVNALKTGKSSSSLRKTRVFHEVAIGVNAEIIWVPGHSKICGNEEADAVARIALPTLPSLQSNPVEISLAYLRRLMHRRRQELVDEWWSKACPARYRDLDLQMRRRKPPELLLSRRLLHELITARTGHGDFASYHRRFKHNNAALECVCGLETPPSLPWCASSGKG